ncbi:MAG: hypothetical protein FWG67_07230 [Defluviitaleaceae bacterium]|nr:hypothetical protein [Defluviitaleaceae bacterium]
MDLVADNILNVIKRSARRIEQDNEQGFFVTQDLLNKAIFETLAEVEFFQEIYKREKSIQSGNFLSHDEVLQVLETV